MATTNLNDIYEKIALVLVVVLRDSSFKCVYTLYGRQSKELSAVDV